MNIQGEYGNPIHGVSMQPDSRMFRGQSRKLENMRCRPTEGLGRRDGWEYVSPLATTSVEQIQQVKWRVHERGDGSVTLFAFAQDTPRLWDLQGNSLPFEFKDDNSRSYYEFGAKDIQKRFGISSVLDTTFVTNREFVPRGSNAGDLVKAPPHFVWLEFKVFEPGSEWVIQIGDKMYGSSLYKENAQVPVDPNEPTEIATRIIWDGWYKPDDTEAIARKNETYQGAYNSETFKLHFTKTPYPDLLMYRYNNWIGLRWSSIVNTSKIPVMIIQGGDSIVMHDNRDVKAIEKLPSVCQSNITVQVKEGSGAELSTGYFISSLLTSNDANGFGPVSWKETVGVNSVGAFNKATMPHTIKWETDKWVFGPQDWKERETGDGDSNPYPSFLLDGIPIQSVGLFQNRVYFAAGETLMFSAVDNYTDLWVESAYYHTDADPFELIVDSDKVNNIQYAGTFDKDLIFFSQNGQFIMPGDNTHTYDKAYVQTSTNYQADLTADPVLAGDNIHFAFSNGAYTGVREYFTDGTSGTQRSVPTTAHVDTYMEGTVRHLSSSTSVDALFLMLKDNADEVFVNEWMIEGNQKQQNAWHKWTIADGLSYEWVGLVGPMLYAVVRQEAAIPTYHLLKMRWTSPSTQYGIDFNVCLDCTSELTPLLERDGYTVYRVPFERDDWTFIIGKDGVSQGFEVRLVKLNSYEWGWPGSNSETLICGVKYKSLWGIASPRVTDQRDVAQELQRLQLSYYMFHFKEVGKVSMETRLPTGRSRTDEYINRRMDSINNRTDYSFTGPDSWKVPLRQNAVGLITELSSDSPMPFTIRALEWAGEYRQRGRRV